MSGSVRELTTRDMWDDRWRATRLPAEVRKGEQRFLDAITDVFDRNFPRGRDVSLLEIGGAPGQWAAYIHRHLGHQVALLDYRRPDCRWPRRTSVASAFPYGWSKATCSIGSCDCLLPTSCCRSA